MHEAALASALADAITSRGLQGKPVRLLVSGGHADHDAFDAALRFHLEAGETAVDTGTLTIIHLPTERPCLACGRLFAAVGLAADCPHCGGIGLARPGPEQVQIEFD